MNSNCQRRSLSFISWAPYCSRSDSIARRLGGESHMVYAPRWGSRYATIAIKYLVQTVRTLLILARQRPRVVFVMAPPSVACLPVWWYCLLTRAKFVIDAHTGALLDERWVRLQWLQRFFSRRAVTTIVTNQHLKSLIESWGATATIVTDVPVYFAEPSRPALSGQLNFVFVSSFGHDEPTTEFLAAAESVPEVTFHVTGDLRCLSKQITARPENVRFTGFLSDEEFVGLLTACDAVLALTTQDHTMQRAAYEAIYLEKPIITSEFELLRRSFPKGAVHVRPTAAGIAGGIREMIVRRQELRQEAVELKKEKLCQWDRVSAQLLRLTGLCDRTENATRTEGVLTNTKSC